MPAVNCRTTSDALSRSRTILFVTLSGTKSPPSMYFMASRPTSGPALHVGTEDVAGGDGNDAESHGNAFCLGSLAGTRRSDDQHSRHDKPLGNCYFY